MVFGSFLYVANKKKQSVYREHAVDFYRFHEGLCIR